MRLQCAMCAQNKQHRDSTVTLITGRHWVAHDVVSGMLPDVAMAIRHQLFDAAWLQGGMVLEGQLREAPT